MVDRKPKSFKVIHNSVETFLLCAIQQTVALKGLDAKNTVTDIIIETIDKTKNHSRLEIFETTFTMIFKGNIK